MVVDLKRDHPQKYYIKMICKSLYIVGMGDYWYEETKRSRTHKILYAIFATIVNGYLILNTLNELLANFRTDLTLKERNDLIQFSLAHPSLSAKFIFLFLSKKKVKLLLERLIEGNSFNFRVLEEERKSVKKAIWYLIVLCIVTYGTLTMTSVDAFAQQKKDGIPFKLEVTAVPGRASSRIGFVLQAIADLHWWCIVTNMVFVDGISFTCLIYLGYKFRLVCKYFEEMRTRTLRNVRSKTKSEKECAQEFEKDFVTGIKLHEDALWCSRNVQDSLGNIYGVQVFESTTLLAICLIKLMASQRSMTNILANSLYISCLLTLNGAYMMAAGDITYEASHLSTAMFYCGWELVRPRRRFRDVAAVALMSSQRPVYMTAFGVITLSHRNFISVIRSSYSFFAVMY